MLTNTAIRQLVARPDLVREFPFLRMTVTLRTCCGEPPRQPNIHAIRSALGIMPHDRKQLFEKMSGLKLG